MYCLNYDYSDYSLEGITCFRELSFVVWLVICLADVFFDRVKILVSLITLCLCACWAGMQTSSVTLFISFSATNNNCGSEPREDQRLYWMAVSRLPPFEAEHEV